MPSETGTSEWPLPTWDPPLPPGLFCPQRLDQQCPCFPHTLEDAHTPVPRNNPGRLHLGRTLLARSALRRCREHRKTALVSRLSWQAGACKQNLPPDAKHKTLSSRPRGLPAPGAEQPETWGGGGTGPGGPLTASCPRTASPRACTTQSHTICVLNIRRFRLNCAGYQIKN